MVWLHSLNQKALDTLRRKIDEYPCVSFDIYNTLVHRDCYKPTELFCFLEEEIDERYHMESHFASLRVSAEMAAFRKSSSEEVTIHQIYSELSMGLSDLEMNWVMEREQALEDEFCRWNPLMQPIYEYCRANKKKILVISDMYLPQNKIAKILGKLGIQYDALFVSSEVQKTKGSGNLFLRVLAELKLQPADVLHIGDNKWGDFLMPMRLGMGAVHIPADNRLNLFFDKAAAAKSSAYGNLCAFINNHSVSHDWKFLPSSVPSEWDYFTQVGYETEGPVLYGFVKWLSNEWKKEHVEKVFFLARDGQLMQRAFEKLGEKIPQEYMFASRRALIVPSLWMDADLSGIGKKTLLPRYITIKTLLNRMGVDYRQFEGWCNLAGFDCLKEYDCRNLLENKTFVEVYETHIRSEVVRNSKEQYELLIKYMKQIGFQGKVAIVDIGWFGNMQAALEKVVKAAGLPVEIYGYYLGLNPATKRLDGLQAKGYLFNKGEDTEIAEKGISFIPVVEVFFAANHGTTLGYGEENGRIIPILDRWEYEAPVRQMDYKKISKIQKGALAFIDDAWGTVAGQILFKDLDAETAFTNWLQMGCYPTCFCANHVGNIHHSDTEIESLAISGDKMNYLIHPERFIHDFIHSTWRVGFLTRTFGEWPPRYRAYRWTKKLARNLSR